MAAPFLAGGIAALAGGDNGWRWAFLLLGVVAFPIALSANTIKEPRRGRHEMQSVLGEELPPEERRAADLACRSPSSGCGRSRASTTSSSAWPRSASRSSPRRCSSTCTSTKSSASTRSSAASSRPIVAIPTLIAIAIAGRRADELFRRSPPGGDGVRRPARRAVRHRAGRRDLAAQHLGGRPRARGRDGLRTRPRSRSFPRSSRRSSPTGCARAARR